MKNKQEVQIFRALGNADRLAILELLRDGKELNAKEMQKHFFLEQSSFSFHLQSLLRAGLLSKRMEGRHHYFKIKPNFKSAFNTIYRCIIE